MNSLSRGVEGQPGVLRTCLEFLDLEESMSCGWFSRRGVEISVLVQELLLQSQEPPDH